MLLHSPQNVNSRSDILVGIYIPTLITSNKENQNSNQDMIEENFLKLKKKQYLR